MGNWRGLIEFAAVASLAFLAATLLQLAAEPRWFGIYGVAAAALIVAPALQLVLWRNLARRGRPRWLSLIVTVPLALAALTQIIFWAAFFGDPQGAPLLGMVREMALPFIRNYGGLALAAYAVASAIVIARAVAPV